MQKENEEIKVEVPTIDFNVDLDAPTKFNGLTLRQINDWEARHRRHCKLAHRQPCTCSAWD